MKSMTGYGYSESDQLEGIGITVEIRAVNRKQLDIKLNIQRELQGLELEIRRFISRYVSRGSVNVKVSLDLNSSALSKTIKVNSDLAKIYIKRAEEIKTGLDITGDLKIKDILLLPNVIETTEPDVISEEFKKELFKTLENALFKFDNTRKEEGLFLKNDIAMRVKLMEELIKEIEPLTKTLPEHYKNKLQKRLEEEKLTHIDDDRLLREIVIYSDKCDVSEEITRLKSHLSQFYKMLENDEKPLGRNLDFLTQEIQREINTLGVKAASTEISPMIVQFKTETEKIREQIQNIE